LNVLMPALGSALFDGCDWLTHAVEAVTAKSIRGLKVNRSRCLEYAHASVGLATLLNTSIGYVAAAEVAHESQTTGRSIGEIVAERGLMSADAFDRLVEQAALFGALKAH
jgi:fumarate hydratase class II/aspartate ammonia-lyase